MKWFVFLFFVAKLSVAFLVGHSFVAHAAFAQPATVHGKKVLETLELARNFHRQSETLPKIVQRVEQKKLLYVSMATKLTASHDFDHLPFPEKSKEEWMQAAETVANGLKLNVNYQVVAGNEDPVICINEQIADNLYGNVRLIAWYRGQLGEAKEKSQFRGSLDLERLIDEYFRSLSKSLPAIKIRKKRQYECGTTTKDKDFQHGNMGNPFNHQSVFFLQVANRWYNRTEKCVPTLCLSNRCQKPPRSMEPSLPPVD